MQVYSVGYQTKRNNNYQQKTQVSNFEMSPQKQLIKFLSSENISKYKMTFEEAKKMCEFLGHKVINKTGSHTQIQIKDNKGILTMVIPHKSENNLSLADKKKLLYLFTQRYNEALRAK